MVRLRASVLEAYLESVQLLRPQWLRLSILPPRCRRQRRLLRWRRRCRRHRYRRRHLIRSTLVRRRDSLRRHLASPVPIQRLRLLHLSAALLRRLLSLTFRGARCRLRSIPAFCPRTRWDRQRHLIPAGHRHTAPALPAGEGAVVLLLATPLLLRPLVCHKRSLRRPASIRSRPRRRRHPILASSVTLLLLLRRAGLLKWLRQLLPLRLPPRMVWLVLAPLAPSRGMSSLAILAGLLVAQRVRSGRALLLVRQALSGLRPQRRSRQQKRSRVVLPLRLGLCRRLPLLHAVIRSLPRRKVCHRRLPQHPVSMPSKRRHRHRPISVSSAMLQRLPAGRQRLLQQVHMLVRQRTSPRPSVLRSARVLLLPMSWRRHLKLLVAPPISLLPGARTSLRRLLIHWPLLLHQLLH